MSLRMNFQKLLAKLEDLDDRVAETVAAGIVNEVSEWAAKNGHPTLVREWTPAAQVVEVRRYLAECIAATTPPPEPGPEPLLSPPKVAELTGSAPETVIEWIKTGFLKASNLATGQRPRYMVKPADLDDFLASRQVPRANAFRARP
ncbi:helix-turn-helix domain-containing protein [Lacipirellula parvula]|uniref:helix-turn-helix domain-containing protein n=1 Tax=Lacipirellula parvula TaxID=2650471 RepID=UPI001261138B|nr:helix-turn-helix domain-containing protein [Lacipirellula parvula]